MRVVFVLISLSALGVAVYAWITYAGRPLGEGVHPEMRAVYETHRAGTYAHVFASSIALVAGPWQFLASLRRKLPGLHRLTGWAYLVLGVGVGGLSGLYMSAFAFGGIVSTTGFGLLAMLWLYTGVRALRAAMKRQYSNHQQWMIRNFALTMAAVTLRLGLGVGFASGLPFEWFYPALAWISWIPNLVLAELVIQRQAVPDRPKGLQV